VGDSDHLGVGYCIGIYAIAREAEISRLKNTAQGVLDAYIKSYLLFMMRSRIVPHSRMR